MQKLIKLSEMQAQRAFKRGSCLMARYQFVGFNCIWFA